MSYSKHDQLKFNYGFVMYPLIALITVSALAILYDVYHKTPSAKIPKIGNKEDRVGATFVGSSSCRDCHEFKYSSWTSTQHAIVFATSSPEVVEGNFTEGYKISDGDVITRPFMKDGKYYVNTVGTDGNNADFEVGWVIAERDAQLYITKFPNGAMHILPLQWDDVKRKWVSYASVDPSNDSFWASRKNIWQISGAGRYTTGLDIGYDPTSDSFNTTWLETGASCEKCHGPGSNHIEAKPGFERETIISPKRFPNPRQKAYLCGQCHGVGTSAHSPEEAINIADAAASFGYPHGYIPGAKLEDFLVAAEPDGTGQGHFWPSGEPRSQGMQWNSWKSSRHAEIGIACIDCHTDIHGEHGSYRMIKNRGNQSCLTCHNDSRPENTIHSIHGTNDCIACHMPQTANTLESVDGGRSHTFRAVLPSETIEAGGLEFQVNSCNSCHYHAKYPPEVLQMTVDHLKSSRKKSLGIDKSGKDEAQQ